jgi:hypothetical protein
MKLFIDREIIFHSLFHVPLIDVVIYIGNIVMKLPLRMTLMPYLLLLRLSLATSSIYILYIRPL